MNIAIIGTGAYGMALASVFYNNKCKIKMWTNSEEEKNILLKNGKSDKVDFMIPRDIVISTDMKDVVDSAELIMIAIPAKFLDSTSKELKKYYNSKQVICIASKGIEQNTCRFLYDVVRENINTNNIAIISGGTFAVDIVYKVPIGLTLATRSNTARDVLLKYMQNDYVKLRHTRDIVGTEICGAIKNVIAIASGMLDGMGYPISTSSMFITESLHDIKALIKALGGNKKTILSFAGFGDLLLTCTSVKSRNYTLGKIIGEGKSKEEINKYIESTTIEGLYTLKSIKKLLRNKKIIGPYNISLWGEYPYIVGDCVLQGPTTIYFVIDIKTGNIEYHKDFDSIRKKYKVNFDYRDFVTFQDLQGQWAKPEKLDTLRKKLSMKERNK